MRLPRRIERLEQLASDPDEIQLTPEQYARLKEACMLAREDPESWGLPRDFFEQFRREREAPIPT